MKLNPRSDCDVAKEEKVTLVLLAIVLSRIQSLQKAVPASMGLVAHLLTVTGTPNLFHCFRLFTALSPLYSVLTMENEY